MLKKLFAGAAIASALGLAAVPASADEHACFTIYVDVNGTIVEQRVCLPEG